MLDAPLPIHDTRRGLTWRCWGQQHQGMQSLLAALADCISWIAAAAERSRQIAWSRRLGQNLAHLPVSEGEHRMLSTKRTPLVMAAIALWTVIGPADPLQGQEKESEADRIRRGCGPPDIKHGVRINAIGRVRQMTVDKAMIHVVRPEEFGSLIQTKLAVD